MALASNRTSSASDVFALLGAPLLRLRTALGRRAVYQQTLRELQALSDRELADLGISQHNIRALAHEAAYGR